MRTPLQVIHQLTHKSNFPEFPKEGDLLVSHFFEQEGNGQTFHLYPVDTPEEAKELIDQLANEQVKDATIVVNAFDLLVYEPEDRSDRTSIRQDEFWNTWFSEDGDEIDQYEPPASAVKLISVPNKL